MIKRVGCHGEQVRTMVRKGLSALLSELGFVNPDSYQN